MSEHTRIFWENEALLITSSRCSREGNVYRVALRHSHEYMPLITLKSAILRGVYPPNNYPIKIRITGLTEEGKVSGSAEFTVLLKTTFEPNERVVLTDQSQEWFKSHLLEIRFLSLDNRLIAFKEKVTWEVFLVLEEHRDPPEI